MNDIYKKLFLGDITHGGNNSNNSVDDGGNDDGPDSQPTQSPGPTQPSQDGSVSQWALGFMLQLLGSQPSQQAPNFSLNSSPVEEEGQQDHNQRLDSQPSQPLPYFSLNSSPEGETTVEGPEEDAVEEMDYFAADGDEDADLYSEDEQEMEVNESSAEPVSYTHLTLPTTLNV